MGIHQKLLNWYRKNRRSLPWRNTRDPYAIWVSEIMLQQTQVAAVIPYYEKFIKRFPTLQILAKASQPEVLSLWTGLGYYTRAKNLHRAAQEIMRHGGKFPSDHESILHLPGIGRYTAGAVASIAFNQPYPVLDGNVARVFSRLYLIRQNIKRPATQKKLWTLAGSLLDKKNPGDWNQALMELGALVCLPANPLCGQCPVSRACQAFGRSQQGKLPNTGKTEAGISLKWNGAVCRKGNSLLLAQRKNENILKNQWGLPLIPEKAAKNLKLLGTVRHAITRYKIEMKVYLVPKAMRFNGQPVRWVPINKLNQYLFSSIWWKALRA